MRKIALVFTLIIAICINSSAQLTPLQQKAITLTRVIQLNHYSPRPLNDSFSVSLFNSLIQSADPRLLLFTQKEYKQLLVFSTKLDDELQGRGSGWTDLFFRLYKKALNRADSIITRLTQKPFDYTLNESITGSNEKSFQFSPDVASLNNKWSRYIKLMILTQAYTSFKADTQDTKDFKTYLIASEPKIRQNVALVEKRNIKKILDHSAGFDNYAAELYLNSIASTFDPHTNYFSPESKENFQSQLSSEGYSFGLYIGESDRGQIIIEGLEPGGPAWKSGELHKGDELIQMHWQGKAPIEVQGMTGEEVSEIMDQSAHDILQMKIKKQNGVIREVSLRKEKMENNENIVKSFILEGEKKIGYILLPGFYTEWENETGSSCASDVAKEIIRLKKDKIDGLILDVRYNGGGSIYEALELAGIFIEEGPMAAIREKSGKVVFLKDPNRGTIYDGPLILMVNGQSASASEMLAASLQDYNRAVIVGSNTYGKATAQQMFLVDSTVSKPTNGTADRDMAKITNSKLYRITGHSAQLNGVTADIRLPDIFDGLKFGEKFEPNVLVADTIKKNNYYQPLSPLPIAELERLSIARTIKKQEFQELAVWISKENNSSELKMRTYPLNAAAFQKWADDMEKNQPVDEGTGSSPTTAFKVINHSQDRDLLKRDEFAREINEVWLDNLSHDFYLEETFFILVNLIQIQPRH